MRHGRLATIVAVIVLAASAPAVAAPGGAPPFLAPTSLNATVTGTSVTLMWNDPNRRETGYQVERRTGAAPFAVVGTVRRNVTTFNDVVSSGVPCDSQVRARGRRSVVSVGSPIKTGKVTPPDVQKQATPQSIVATWISGA